MKKSAHEVPAVNIVFCNGERSHSRRYGTQRSARRGAAAGRADRHCTFNVTVGDVVERPASFVAVTVKLRGPAAAADETVVSRANLPAPCSLMENVVVPVAFVQLTIAWVTVPLSVMSAVMFSG